MIEEVGSPTPTETRPSIGGVLGGGGAPKGVPSSRRFLVIHQEMSMSTCRDQGTGRCGGSVSVYQLDFRCHWRERIGVLRGVPASPTTTGVPTTLATVEPAGSVGLGTSLPGRGISVCGPRWGMLGQTLCL